MTAAEFARYFRAYYRSLGRDALASIEELPAREIMFHSFSGAVIRHMSVASAAELLEELRRIVPRHAYFSAAKYLNPAAPEMEDKGLLGAELMFDIDADHVRGCIGPGVWECKRCGASGAGRRPRRCKACGSTEIRWDPWPNPDCLEAVFREARKVVNILREDFGLGRKIRVFFTGNRGLHIMVRDDRAISLDKRAREAIAAQVAAAGLDPIAFSLREKGRGIAIVGAGFGGWPRRVASVLAEGLDSPASSRLMREKFVPGISTARMKSAAKRAAARFAAEIDVQVTGDPHRFFRIPNSLHGKTGMMVMEVRLDDDPVEVLTKARALPAEEVRVNVAAPIPRFFVGGRWFGPFKAGRTVRLPLFAAAVAVLRGRANLVQVGGDAR